MIRIVGRKVLMQQGEAGAFRILLIDSKGNEVTLTEEDRFIFRAKHSMESNDSLRIVSTPIKSVIDSNIKIYHIIEFSSSDTSNLLSGDYHYELLLDRDSQRTIVIPTSVLTIEESIQSIFPEDNISISENPSENDEDFLIIFGDDDDSDEDDIIIFEENDDSDYYYSIITSTPLIGNFDVIVHKRLVNTGDGNSDLIII